MNKNDYEVILTDAAGNDLFEIYRYLADHASLKKADELIGELKSACFSLQDLPNRGHTPQEFQVLNISDYLEIHHKEYRIIYEISIRRIYVYAIIHMRKDVFDLLKDRMLS